MEIIDKLAWICIKDGKVLCTRTRGKDAWYLPGGKRESGEADQDALMREVKEELGIDLKPETIKKVETFVAPAHGKPAGVFVQSTCYAADFIGELKPSAEIEEIVYLDSRADRKSLSIMCGVIIDWLKERELIN